MKPIPLKDAVEQLAQAVEKAPPDELVEYYAELFPAQKTRPDVSGDKAAGLAQDLAQRVRNGIEPEEVVDLWNVVFPVVQRVYYDEEDATLRPAHRVLRSEEY